MTQKCPFHVGDTVRFVPNSRTMMLYQDVSGFGIRPGEVAKIVCIKDDTYLYFENGAGGWPWNEFKLVLPDFPGPV